MNRVMWLVFLCLCLLVAACSKEKKAGANEEPDVAEESVEEESNSLIDDIEKVTIGFSRNDLKEQVGGSLVDNISEEEEYGDISDPLFDANELQGELKKITAETQDPLQIQKGIVYLLGSHHYKSAIENAEAFKPDFEEPYLPNPGKAEERVDSEQEDGKAIILLDASSSMLLSVDGRVKMDIAKEAVERFAEVIGQDSDISLVVYGHKGSESDADKELSCNGIEEVYPMGAYDKEAFDEALTSFDSKGYTPLAGAVHTAAEMSKDIDGDITVYIVSDGVETCDGNPVKEAEAFVENNEGGIVNIIGFHVDQDAENQLKKVSEAGNGEYYAANNADELKTTIEDEWLPSLGDLAWAFTKAPGPWEELAEYDRFDIELDLLKKVITNENERYKAALNILRDKEMLESDVVDEVQTLISDRYSKMMDTSSEFRTEKIDEIKDAARDIRKRVDEWTEEMRRLKEERGDIF